MIRSSLDLTIVIPVLNEEKNLPSCLAAIGPGFARKVVIVDSGSTDGTRDIATKYRAEFVDFVWNGRFPKKRNWFLRNYQLDTKWIMFLDADEYLTEEFKQELYKKIQNDDVVGFWLSYTIYFMGKNLKGGYPLKKLALFRVGAGEYEKIDEELWSKLDMEIHEHPILNGKVGQIKSKIDHQDFRGIAHYVNKHSEYANWEASRFLKAADEQTTTAKWTWKQRLKYRLMKSVWMGPIYFFGSFFFLAGFRDGARGFVFAILKMSYFTQVYCKIFEKQGNENPQSQI